MELSHSLRLRQQTKLVMTPQLQMVIKLLQLPTLELVETVRQELETNPTLEEGQPEPGDEQAAKDAETEKIGPAEDDGIDAWLKLAEQEGPRESRDFKREEEMEERTERRLVQVDSLTDHLIAQLHETEAPEPQVRLAEIIIGNLNDNGWLGTPLEELAGPAKVSVAEFERALALVQSLEPAGIGARDLRECLLLQLGNSSEDDALARRIVEERLDDLEGGAPGVPLPPNALARLAKALGGLPVARVEAAVRRIRTCDPRPGARFATPPPRVYPDATIEKVGGEYVVQLNDGGLPPLRLSQSYRDLLANRNTLGKDEKLYLQERFRSALMLMRGIEQRRMTLHRVLEHVVKAQQEFLDQGPAHLKPLTLREIADVVGVHESTVSRVVANKYIATPRGTIELKTFFSNRLAAATGAGTSSTAVRERLRDLVATEHPDTPLSDEQLADRLKADGIAIARRTVTKYREALRIPPAWQRKGAIHTERSL